MTRAWPLSLELTSVPDSGGQAWPCIDQPRIPPASLGPWRPGDPNQWSCLRWAWHYWQVFVYKSLGNQTRHSLRHGTHLFPFIRNELINFRQINLSWLDGAVSKSAHFRGKVLDINCFYCSFTQHNAHYFFFKYLYWLHIWKSFIISMLHFQKKLIREKKINLFVF